MEGIKFKKYTSYIIGVLLISASVLWGISFSAKASGSAAISYSTSKSTIVTGDSFDIKVNISGVSNFYGASMDFKYDPTLLKVTGISKGSIFSNVSSVTPVNKNSTSSGLISYACTLQGASAGLNSTSSKTLFIIHAKALKSGSVNLKTIATNGTLSNTGSNVRIKLVDSTKNNNPINYTAASSALNLGSITPVSMKSISVDKTSPQIAYTKIKLTANASGGSGLLYKFRIYDGSSWKIVRDYSSSNTYYWTPTKATNYKIRAYARDTTSGRVAYKEISYSISSSFRISSLKADKLSPQIANTRIKLTTTASGGSGLIYKFRVFDGSSWKIVRDYSSSNTYYWTPTKAANYKIRTYAKDKITGKIAYKEMSYTINSSFKISSFKADKLSPQVANTRIKLTTTASGGSGLIYKFRVYDGSSWKIVRDYSSSNIYYWTPTKAANYKIRTYAKDKITGKIVYKEMSFTINSSFKISSFKADKLSPQVANTRIKLSTTASGGSGLIYKFRVYDGSSWKIVRDYSSSNIYYWTPTKAANYKIRTYAKDKNTGKIAYKEMSYTISRI